MAWREVSAVQGRCEFCERAVLDGANVSALCRQFGISRKTGYKWLGRWRAAEAAAGGRDAEAARAVMRDVSRRPQRSPARTAARVEALLLAARERHPAWGGRKLLAWLRADAERLGGVPASALPAASTAGAILLRRGRIHPVESARRQRADQRFERAAPNDLWQMDFKGHFAAGAARCHALTVLDDHSRFAIGLTACGDERGETVQARLTAAFEEYGLPAELLCDNGPPWGGWSGGGWSALAVWLMRLGVAVTHGRPYHPQTQGKDERFHRTLGAEVLRRHRPASLAACQQRFDAWREVYNHERPHQALGFATPASRYHPSPRPMPARLPPVEYAAGDAVRKVQSDGGIEFQGRRWYLGKAWRGQHVALRPTGRDGEWAACFGRVRITTLDFTVPDGEL